MSEQGTDPLGTLDLATRLEVGAEGFGDGTYADLRVAGAVHLRAGGDGAEGLGEALVALEPLLSRSYLLGQPNLAGMGVSPWDLSVATPAEAIISRVTERTRRMIGGGALAGLDGPAEAPRPDDRQAIERGADLVEALQRLDQAAAGLPEETPLAAQVARLRGELTARLGQERRHHQGLDRACDAETWPIPPPSRPCGHRRPRPPRPAPAPPRPPATPMAKPSRPPSPTSCAPSRAPWITPGWRTCAPASSRPPRPPWPATPPRPRPAASPSRPAA
ncbi:MAG: hypothetical protein R3F43_23440 [bacterium]